MNIENIPVEHLNRGVIVSIMERERPFIECFSDGTGVVPVVFLRGLPMPYSVFVCFMAMRFAPERTKGQMPKMYDPVSGFTLPRDSELRSFWSKVDVPTEIRKKIDQNAKYGTVVHDLVSELYLRHVNSEQEESVRSFREMIHRIEEDYQSSLIDPVEV